MIKVKIFSHAISSKKVVYVVRSIEELIYQIAIEPNEQLSILTACQGIGCNDSSGNNWFDGDLVTINNNLFLTVWNAHTNKWALLNLAGGYLSDFPSASDISAHNYTIVGSVLTAELTKNQEETIKNWLTCADVGEAYSIEHNYMASFGIEANKLPIQVLEQLGAMPSHPIPKGAELKISNYCLYVDGKPFIVENEGESDSLSHIDASGNLVIASPPENDREAMTEGYIEVTIAPADIRGYFA